MSSTQQSIGSGLSQASIPAQQATKKIGQKLNQKRLEQARKNIQRRKEEFKKAQAERKAKMDKLKAEREQTRQKINPPKTEIEEPQNLPDSQDFQARNIQNRILDNLREQVAQKQQDESNITQQTQEQEGQRTQTDYKPSDEDISNNVPKNQPSLEDEEVDITKSASKVEKGASKLGEVGEDLLTAGETTEETGEGNVVSDIVGGVLALGGAIFSEIAPDKEESKPPPQPTIQEQTGSQAFEV